MTTSGSICSSGAQKGTSHAAAFGLCENVSANSRARSTASDLANNDVCPARDMTRIGHCAREDCPHPALALATCMRIVEVERRDATPVEPPMPATYTHDRRNGKRSYAAELYPRTTNADLPTWSDLDGGDSYGGLTRASSATMIGCAGSLGYVARSAPRSVATSAKHDPCRWRRSAWPARQLRATR